MITHKSKVRFALLWALLSIAALQAALSDPWIDRGYLYRIAITNLFPASPTPILNDFPVLIAITNASWLKASDSSGGDITFAGVDGQQLFHEIEFYDWSGGFANLQAWVCLPTFSNNTTIYMYWKNPGPSLVFSGSNTTYALATTLPSLTNADIFTNTWDSNFLTVMHFGETTALPRPRRDSSRYKTTATTEMGSNIAYSTVNITYSNMVVSPSYIVTSAVPYTNTEQAQGIGIGQINTVGWLGGLISTNVKFNTPGGGKATASTRGVFIDAFNNKPGTSPAYDAYMGSRNVTASLWVRWLDYPTNQLFIRGQTTPTSGWSNFTASNLTYLNVMTMKRNGDHTGAGGSDMQLGFKASMVSNGNIWNGMPRVRHLSQGTDGAPLMAVTNITNIGAPGPYSTWIRYATTGTFINDRVTVTNYVNHALSYGLALTGPVLPTTTMLGVYLAGVDSDYVASTASNYYFTPRMVFDEFRMSVGVRSSNWLQTEYWNVVASSNMAASNGLDAASVENLLTGAVTNFNAFGSPAAGGHVRLGLDAASLIIPEYPATFLTNVAWLVTNTTTGWSNVTNLVYAGPTNDYSWIQSNLTAGYYRISALLTSSVADQGAARAYTLVVGSEPTYDLSRFSIVQTNTGFVLDLFSGYDGGAARPTGVTFTRDGVAYAKMAALPGNRYLDTNDLFYDDSVAYRAEIQYSNYLYYSNYLRVTALKRTVTNLITASGDDASRQLLNLELAAQFPSGGLSTDRDYVLSFPPDVVGIDGYRQMVIDDGDGLYGNFSQPVGVRLKVRVSGGYVLVPGTSKRVVLAEASRLTLGYWDGFQWNALSTSMVPYSNRVEVHSSISREGRIALMFNEGSSAAVDPFRLRNRMLVPGSADSTYNTMLFSWNKTTSEAATLSIYSQSGRLVFQKKNMLDPLWIWDGRGNDGQLVPAGVYLYAATVGAARVYRGSLVVMGQ
jgi:hypothetical protein